MTYTTRPSGADTAPRADQPLAAGPADAAAEAATAGVPVPREGTGAADPPRPRKERDPFFDNAKYFAIVLVVVGHSIAYLQDVPLAQGVYLWLYMFHMPLFIVITGYFSRNWSFSDGKARKLITNVGVPYVVFETAYSLYHWLGGGNKLEISLLNPYYLTWFLLALFLWRLSTPVWQQVRWPLAIAVGIALLSYTSDLGGTFDIHRVLGLLPFYVLGLVLKPEHFELLKKPILRPIGAVVLLAGLGVSFLVMDRVSRNWIYWNRPHDSFGVDNFTGSLMRLAMFACALILLAAFLTQIPRKRYWFTGLGAATLYAYLLHGFLTRTMNFTDGWSIDWMHTVPGILIVSAIAAVVGTLLCTKWVTRAMSWAVEPKMTWVFTPLRKPGAKPAAKPTAKASADQGAKPDGKH